MKKFGLLLILILSSGFLFAQQENQFTMFMYNKLMLNPAVAGSRGVTSVTAIYRRQWIGYDGAPISKLVSINTPVLGRGIGFGLTVANHSHGIFDNWSGTMAYSYKLQMSEDVYASFGIQGSIRYFGIDFSDPNFYTVDGQDPSVVENMDTNQYKANFGAGLYLTLKKAYLGISLPNMLANEITFNTQNDIQIAKERPHAYFMGGAVLPVNQSIQLRPAVITKYVKNAPFDYELNLSMIYANQIITGLSYRSNESIDIMAIYQMNKIALGLAYDFTMGELGDQTVGSIEALVRFDFTGAQSDIANPRFFF